MMEHNPFVFLDHVTRNVGSSGSSGVRGGQFPHVRDVPRCNGPHLSWWQRDNCDRLASQGHELDLIGRCVRMDVNDGADVPGLEVFLCEIKSQNDAIVFVNHSLKSWLLAARERG